MVKGENFFIEGEGSLKGEIEVSLRGNRFLLGEIE